MRNLTRSSVEELRREMPVLTVEEEREVIGGTYVGAIRINGGQSVLFGGVVCSNSSAPDGSACQLSGVIRVGENPAENFDISLMIHEYGHYMQQEEMGIMTYLVYAGSGSAYGRMSDTPYYQIPSEADASNRGNEYIDSYYPESGYKAP